MEPEAFEAAPFEAPSPDNVFYGQGTATAEFIGTTAFAALIESGDGLMTIAAEIHLRSLG